MKVERGLSFNFAVTILAEGWLPEWQKLSSGDRRLAWLMARWQSLSNGRPRRRADTRNRLDSDLSTRGTRWGESLESQRIISDQKNLFRAVGM